MCYTINCSSCEKTTWAGCGRHADSVLRSVPAADRCTCAARPTPQPKSGFIRALFGR